MKIKISKQVGNKEKFQLEEKLFSLYDQRSSLRRKMRRAKDKCCFKNKLKKVNSQIQNLTKKILILSTTKAD
ncbi:MAG TPA: hypothetical protein PLO44_00865 [Candidatus Paceibacterota bacterium]|nr:hypothetical protein [Candidatus Paceibacterota bacterium]